MHYSSELTEIYWNTVGTQLELNSLLPSALKEIVCVCLVGLSLGLVCVHARLCLVSQVPITSLVIGVLEEYTT